jgi:hypothetical protein
MESFAGIPSHDRRRGWSGSGAASVSGVAGLATGHVALSLAIIRIC